MVRPNFVQGETPMGKSIRTMLAAFGALALMSGAAMAQKVTIAVGGAGCLCYLPTMLAEQLGEYKKAGVEVELVDFKGGAPARTPAVGGAREGGRRVGGGG